MLSVRHAKNVFLWLWLICMWTVRMVVLVWCLLKWPRRPVHHHHQHSTLSTVTCLHRQLSQLLSRCVSARDVVLETAVLVSRALETDFSRFWSWSWSWDRRSWFWSWYLQSWSWSWSRRVGLEYFSTSAPVERIFSHGGIFMHPHRARMSDTVLCDLVFAKCNTQL